jgi:hypothetical protein
MTVLVFIGAWFLPAVEEVSGYVPAYKIWYDFITRDYIGSASGVLVMIVVMTCSFGLVAAVVGWLLQFPICIIWKYFRRRRRDKSSAS